MMQILSLNQQGRPDYNHVHRGSSSKGFNWRSTASLFGLIYQLVVAFVGQRRGC